MYHKLQASNSFERRAVESAIAPVDAQEGAEQATSSPSSRPPPQPHSSQVAELNRQAFMLNAASNVDSSNLSESAINRWNSQTTTINQAPPHASPEALQSPLSPSFIISSDNDIHMLHSDHQDIAATPKSSLKSVWSTASMANSLSPAPSSAVSSPALAAMSDITPLPSPLLMGSSSPPSWRRSQTSRPGSQGDNPPLPKDQAMYAQTSINTSPTKKKAYGSLTPAALEASRAYNRNARAHSRNRSLSEYTPDTLYNTRPRHATLSESSQAQGHPSTATLLQRENYLAEVRGLATQAPQFQQPTLPTPPASNVSTTGSEGEEMKDEEAGTHVEVYTVRKHSDNKRQKTYRLVRLLGQGTFSKVILGTSDSQYLSSKAVPPESALSPKSLVAIKIVERGPAGGADEERVELGLHREVETLLSLNHPALVRIKTFDLDVSPALLVLDYCPGGDLYELATQASDPLLQGVVRRIFAELVSAVRYLHSEWIAHRDIKLENVLVNLPPSSLLYPSQAFLSSLPSHPFPIVTLTDLGLCKRIPQPPSSPLLTTRCGSEDYAAPEILLGQSYDGRATDAWALGVLLYALMERRLPFDAPPSMKGRKGRPAHRIARCEWVWCRFGDEDGDWEDVEKNREWMGARKAVESLLKKVSRGRASLDEVAEMEWVKGAIDVPGGLRRPDDESEDERLERVERRVRYPFKRMDTSMIVERHSPDES